MMRHLEELHVRVVNTNRAMCVASSNFETMELRTRALKKALDLWPEASLERQRLIQQVPEVYLELLEAR